MPKLPADLAAEIVKPQANCKMCHLAESHGNIVRVCHELARRGVTGQPLEKRLQPVFQEAGLEQPSRPAMMRHLEKHCALVADAPSEEETNDYETDYFELREIYTEVKKIFENVREEFSEAKEKGKKTSDYGLVMLLKLVTELRHMLKTLSDMRNSEKLVAVILTRHTEQLLERTALSVSLPVRDIRDRLRRGEAPDVLADELDRLLDEEFPAMMQTAGQTTLDQSRQQYKLH